MVQYTVTTKKLIGQINSKVMWCRMSQFYFSLMSGSVAHLREAIRCTVSIMSTMFVNYWNETNTPHCQTEKVSMARFIPIMIALTTKLDLHPNPLPLAIKS